MWCCLLLIISSTIICSDDATLFKEANMLYQQGAYEDALNLYEKIEHKTAALFYNMGNAAYNKSDYMYAYLYWLRAQQHGNMRIFKASGRNIALLAQQDLAQKQSPFFLWWWSFTKAAPLFLWQLIFLIIWSWLLIMIWKGIISRRDLLISIFILTMLASILLAGYSAAKTEAMIINDAMIYNGPNNSYYQIGSLPKGKIVTVAKTKQDWINIVADGNVGWVSQEYVAQI